MKQCLFIFFLYMVVVSCSSRTEPVHDRGGSLADKPGGASIDSVPLPDTTGYPIFDRWMSDTLKRISSISNDEPFVIKREIIPDSSSHNLVINTSYRVPVKAQSVYKGDVERLMKLLAEYKENPSRGSILSFTTNYWYGPSVTGQAYELVFRYNPILLKDSINRRSVEYFYVRGRLSGKYSISVDKSGKRDSSEYRFTKDDANLH